MSSLFNNRLRQIILLLIVILLALLLLQQLYSFMPGFLGAITLYILFRASYFNLTIKKKWNKTLVALLFIIASMVLIAIPLFFSIELVTAKVGNILSNPIDIVMKAKLVGNKIKEVTGFKLLTDENIKNFQGRAGNFIPKIINSSAGILSNFAIMFFLLYFLLKNGREVEKMLQQSIPLKEENIELLSNETKNIIRANAIGIPVLAIIQGVVATIGYAIFGVTDYGLWGFMTGVCSMLPVVGTAIIWVPLTAYFFASGNHSPAVGLLIYSVVVITNVDYVARLTILKKLIDVHPLITIFGVIVGIGLFGFWGVIFGPLLISYFIILVRIYINEFGKPANQPIQ
ncbi:MAG: AI-2E family transporter [Chitinophagaceae bacterium]|nr:AI-2E family transporter [Chitinophagaceae bacterium]